MGVALAYYTNREAKGFVTVDGDRQSVTFLRGAHTLTLVHHGTATSLTIEGGGSSLCIGTITIGDVKPSLAGDV